ncbi:MAG: hypothetical protein NC935_08360, partial [Candidatus Omnitrophica bacterium]|nr:hypothetical protein [Candidatus Omnitrophota bacterium]
MRKKTTLKNLELGQIAFQKYIGKYQVDDFMEALFSYIFKEIERVFWNINQYEYKVGSDLDWGKLKVRSYYWGDEEKEAEKPNFEFKGVKLYWYKYFGRGMTVDLPKNIKSELDFIKWFNRCLKYI